MGASELNTLVSVLDKTKDHTLIQGVYVALENVLNELREKLLFDVKEEVLSNKESFKYRTYQSLI